MTVLETRPAQVGRTATRRRYLMCRPDHFEVRYAFNPWMDPTAPVDRERALAQPERAAEGPAYLDRLRAAGLEQVIEATCTNEGEGDFTVVGQRVLAGTGFRTSRAAYAEAATALGVEVVSLELVDPRYYHLDTCLAALDRTTSSTTRAPSAQTASRCSSGSTRTPSSPRGRMPRPSGSTASATGCAS